MRSAHPEEYSILEPALGARIQEMPKQSLCCVEICANAISSNAMYDSELLALKSMTLETKLFTLEKMVMHSLATETG